MKRLELICTDLDGTLLGDTVLAEAYHQFGDLVRGAQSNQGTRWAIVTGRRLVDVRAIVLHFAGYGIRPDFLIVEDALIHWLDRRGGLHGFWWWNFTVMRRRTTLFRRNNQQIQHWREMILAKFPQAADRSRQQVDLWVEFTDEDQAVRAEILLKDALGDSHRFAVFRWGRELFLAPSAGTKGEAVAKLCRAQGIRREHVFAVGDGPNDLSMLNGQAARYTACVANALPQVREVVKGAGGYVAAGERMAGVIESLQVVMGLNAGARTNE